MTHHQFLVLLIMVLLLSIIGIESSIICHEYADRDYYPESVVYDDNRHPILLLSIPGSGNTWMRLLIDYSTGTMFDSSLNYLVT